jgi:LmbE family N-acetylglucosaminyl deacetylase
MSVGAHADDIEINTGATCLKYRDLGYDIVYVMATNNMSGATKELQPDGSVTRRKEGTVDMMKRRKRECDDAAKVLGTTPIHLDHPQRHYNSDIGDEQLEVRYGCPLPDGVAENAPTILTACEDEASIGRLANLILEKDPECIFTHGVANTNIEHFAVSLLVTNAFWKAVEQGYAGGLLHWVEEHTLHGHFHTRWETFVGATGYLDKKMELIGLHRCQMPTAHKPDHGHRLLSEWRGKVCGYEVAEVFTWVRQPTRLSHGFGSTATPVMGELTKELLDNTR